MRRRICISALFVGALSFPAWAAPLATPSDAMNVAQIADAHLQAAPAAAPLRLVAAQPDLGGGFIQFLFEDAAAPSASRTYGTTSAGAGLSAAPQVTALAGDADGILTEGDDGHPPLDPKYDRQIVNYDTTEKPGTIIIDTQHKFLYLVEEGGKALRYGIGVGRPGFTWAGVKTITAKREWPDWRPPEAMLKRQPELPRFMAGGPQNPLGARAMYLGSTDYRIHGSNEPWTIGHNVSSGCIRLRNADVIDLYNRVKVGTKVVVM